MKQRNRRKTRQTARLFLAFGAGMAGGLMLAFSMEVWAQHPGLPGGEALIPLLIVLLVYLGWQLKEIWQDIQG